MDNKAHGYLNRYSFDLESNLVLSVLNFERGDIQRAADVERDIEIAVGRLMEKFESQEEVPMLHLKSCVLEAMDKRGQRDMYSDKDFNDKYEYAVRPP